MKADTTWEMAVVAALALVALAFAAGCTVHFDKMCDGIFVTYAAPEAMPTFVPPPYPTLFPPALP